MVERQDADELVGLPMQRNDVADYLGLTFETVSRALRTLRDAGIIRVPSVHQIEIVDADALERLAA
ncbi:Nitrogen fixation regulation protein FixK [compost metagenome]